LLPNDRLMAVGSHPRWSLECLFELPSLSPGQLVGALRNYFSDFDRQAKNAIPASAQAAPANANATIARSQVPPKLPCGDIAPTANKSATIRREPLASVGKSSRIHFALASRTTLFPNSIECPWLCYKLTEALDEFLMSCFSEA